MEVAKQNVLLVDDEPQVLVALEDILSDEFTVFKTESPEAALRLVENENISVVMSDQRMPEMSGDELLTRLCTSSDATRILVTGYADLSAVIRAVNDGRIFAYVTKPWDPEDLRLMVRKAAEHFRLAHDLAHERQLLHDLMDNVPDGIYFKDRQLRFLRANRAFSRLVGGGAPDALTGRRLGDLLPGSDTEVSEAEERRILSEGLPAQDVVREFQSSGMKHWLSETKAPIRSPGGDVIGLVCISRDVTERVSTQDALRRLEQQLLQSQKMEAIGQLAGGVAHDFNNLLSVIMGYGELVLQACEESDERRADMVELLGASQRAAALTRQLLAFSRRQVIQPELVDLNEIVANVEKMLRRIIGEDIQIKTDFRPPRAMIRADPNQIEQILLNLTVNARDAMPDGGRIEIGTAEASFGPDQASLHPGVGAGQFIELSFADNGSGMDAETQKRIFEPFFTTKPVGKGTGLGLATVYGIVQQCGGQIRLESELGRGTRFRIYFPKAAAQHSESMIRRASTRPPTGSGTILLVEDEEAVRHVTARILRESGYQVIEARDPSQARELAERHKDTIDALLVDVVMPETSGIKLADELGAVLPGLRVLFMSGYSGGGHHHASLELGAAFIEKPFTPAALAKKLRDVLYGGVPG
ncbi:MAG TPA: response regulator [Polyangiaceae bacterium]